MFGQSGEGRDAWAAVLVGRSSWHPAGSWVGLVILGWSGVEASGCSGVAG
jgi:hypothetical protein